MYNRTRMILHLGPSTPVYHSFTYPSRFFTTSQLMAATTPGTSHNHNNSSIFDHHGTSKSPLKSLKDRLFGSHGDAVSEHLPDDRHIQDDAGDVENWVKLGKGMEPGHAVSSNSGSGGGTGNGKNDDDGDGNDEARNRAAMEGMLAGMKAGIADRMGDGPQPKGVVTPHYGKPSDFVNTPAGQEQVRQGRVKVVPEDRVFPTSEEEKNSAAVEGVEPGDTVGTSPDPFVFGRGDERKSM